MKRLSGHTSPETAYVVEDYPYGYTLRCKIRYWLDWRAGYGYRFMSQTTNPKKAGEVWNKEKCSTYSLGIATLMFLNEENHVTWDSCVLYSREHTQKFLDKYREILLPEEIQRLENTLTLFDVRAAAAAKN